MINRVSNSYPTTFTGINIDTIKNFIPEIQLTAARKISQELSKEIPYDELTMMLRESNLFSHSVILGSDNIPIGDIRYTGQNTMHDKIEFLYDVVKQIKDGSFYI